MKKILFTLCMLTSSLSFSIEAGDPIETYCLEEVKHGSSLASPGCMIALKKNHNVEKNDGVKINRADFIKSVKIPTDCDNVSVLLGSKESISSEDISSLKELINKNSQVKTIEFVVYPIKLSSTALGLATMLYENEMGSFKEDAFQPLLELSESLDSVQIKNFFGASIDHLMNKLKENGNFKIEKIASTQHQNRFHLSIIRPQ